MFLSKKLRKYITLVVFILLSSSISSSIVCALSCPIVVYEGQSVVLDPDAYDPDPEIGPAGRLVWEFGQPFNNKGAWQTKKGQRGIFDFWVSVSDGEFSSVNYSCVEVLPYNLPPVLEEISPFELVRGESKKIEAVCTDPDGDAVEITYRFNGKDVSYVLYEPPGVYSLEVVCSDGFGGSDTKETSVTILMPEPEFVPIKKPEPVSVDESIRVNEILPETVELVLPESKAQNVSEDELAVIYTIGSYNCPPCPSEDIIVAYELPVDETKSRIFVLEHSIEDAKTDSQCEKDLRRKEKITLTLGCCS
jgi:hypothetical protein